LKARTFLQLASSLGRSNRRLANLIDGFEFMQNFDKAEDAALKTREKLAQEAETKKKKG